MAEAALQVKDLFKRYPTGVEALRGVSLDIEDGEFFGLLGPNGAGKSTLIHCATGLAQPTAGEIRVFGHDAIGDYTEARQAVGLAPQELNLDWFLTVEETLDYHAGYFGMPRRERCERAKELLETFSLTSKREERTRTLSGGMKRRLILARALMHRPRLLILDEPTAGVDIELRLELWHYVRRINQEGTTILLTTHYLEEAELPAGTNEWEPAPAEEALESALDEEEGIAEAIIEEVVHEVTSRLRQEAADAVELLRAERERLEETLDRLQELVAEASEGVWQESGMEAAAVEEDDDGELRGLPGAAEVDLNQAGQSELRALGMSETQAARVIRHRAFYGEFRSVDELDHVPGFVPHFRDQLKQHLVVSPDG